MIDLLVPDIMDLIIKKTKGISSLNLLKYNQKIKNILKNCNIKIKIDLNNEIQLIDEDLKYLKGVHTIDLIRVNKITDKGLEYLKGVHTIDLSGCEQITDKGLGYFKGVQMIDLYRCDKITDKGLEYLKDAIIHKWKK